MAFWDDIKQSGQTQPTPSIPPKTPVVTPKAPTPILSPIQPQRGQVAPKLGFWDTIQQQTTPPRTAFSTPPVSPKVASVIRPPKTEVFPEPKAPEIEPNLLISTFKEKKNYYDKAVSDFETKLKKHEEEVSYWMQNQDKLDQATYNLLKAEEEGINREIQSLNGVRNSLNLNVAELQKYQSKIQAENIKNLLGKKEVIFSGPEPTKTSRIFEKYVPPILKSVVNDIKEAFVGTGQGVDLFGTGKEDKGLFGGIVPSLARTNLQRVGERYDSLVASGISPERATQISTTYARNRLSDPLARMNQKAIQEKTLKELNLTGDEKSALNKVKYFEWLETGLDALNFTGVGSIGGKTIVKTIAKETYKQPIKNLLLKEIPNITDDVADGAARFLTKVSDQKTVEKFLSELDFSINQYKPKPIPDEIPEIPAPKAPVYEGEKDLTTKILKDLEGRDDVSYQYIQDATNRPELKQTEKDIIRNVLEDYTGVDKVPVKEFAEKVKAELLPLRSTINMDTKGYDSEEGTSGKYESITLPEEQRGQVQDYAERIYRSPIETSAGQAHFPEVKDYFGHTRIEDVPGGTRRVIEVQSDLYQKGNLEREVPPGPQRQYLDQYDEDTLYHAGAKMPSLEETMKESPDQKRVKEVRKLQQYSNPTAHFRMVREEVKKAAIDGKTKLQFPTGETAMKIEGLGQGDNNRFTIGREDDFNAILRISDIEVGKIIAEDGDRGSQWIITDVLGDGKFKAVPKNAYDKFIKQGFTKDEAISASIGDELTESFDISGKVDTNNPIYKFYEKDLGRYLKNNYDAKLVTDKQGVSWYELDVKPETGGQPILAFSRESSNIKRYDKQTKNLRTNRPLFSPRRGERDLTSSESFSRRGTQDRQGSTPSGDNRPTTNKDTRSGSTPSVRQVKDVSGRIATQDEQNRILVESNEDRKLFAQGKISKDKFISNISKRSRELGVPEPTTSALAETLKGMPDDVLSKFEGVQYLSDEIKNNSGSFAGFASYKNGSLWSFQLNENRLNDPKLKTPLTVRHEVSGHATYAFSDSEFRKSINNEVDVILNKENSEVVLKTLFSLDGKGPYVQTIRSYFADELKRTNDILLDYLDEIGKIEKSAVIKSIFNELGYGYDNVSILSKTQGKPYFDKIKNLWKDVENEFKNKYPQLWDEKAWGKFTRARSSSPIRNEFFARYIERRSIAPSETKEIMKGTEIDRLAIIAEKNPEKLFKDIKAREGMYSIADKQLEPPIPGEPKESKLETAREAMKAREKKGALEPIEILTTNKEDRLLIERAMKEMNRISKRESFLESLKIKLPKEFETRSTELIIRKQALDENPLKNVIKYMSRRGEFKGELPEVTGEGPGKFSQRGDDILTETTGIDDTEKARSAFSTYMKQRKQWESDMANYQAEKESFLKETRGKRAEVISEKKVEKLTEKTEKHIGDILDTEAKKKATIERAKKAEIESQENLKRIEDMKNRYREQVKKAHLKESEKETLLGKFKAILAPIDKTDAVTKKIYIDWETSKLKAKEDGNKTYEIYKAKANNDMPSIIDYEAGRKTPWIKEAFDDLFTEAKREGLDLYYKEDYIPHVYNEKPEQIKKAVVKYMEDERVAKEIIEQFKKTGEVPETIAIRLKIRPNFQKIRTFPDYRTAMKYNLTPRFNTVAEHLAYYREEMGKTLANQKLIDDLISNGKLLDAYDAPESWIEVKLPGRLRRSYYGEKNLAEALNGQFRDEENLSFMQSVHKRLAATSQLAQDIVLTGGIPGTVVNNFAIGQAIRMLTTGVGEAAKLNLKGASTAVKAAYSFLRANFQNSSIRFFKENQKYVDLMAEHNVPIMRKASDYTQNYRTWKNLLGRKSRKEGLTAVKNTLKEMKDAPNIREFGKAFMGIFDSRAIGVPVDIFQKALSDKTFMNMMPQMQIQVFKDIYEGAVKAGMKTEEAGAFAGQTVRNEFGAINELGRTQATKDVFSSYFFAPRFREGMVNIFINGAKAWTSEFKNPTFARSRSLILGMIISYIAYNYLNKQLNDGDDMWENESGREFALKIPLPSGRIIYTDFMPSSLAFLRNMGSGAISIFKGDSKTATQKFGTLFSIPIKLATEIVGNKDYFGRPIYEQTDSVGDKAKKAAEHLGLGISHPYIRELVKFFEDKQDIYQTMTMMAELPVKFSNEEKAAMARHYEEKREKAELNTRERDEIRDMVDTYDTVQKLKVEGNTATIDTIIDGLSEKQYQQYKVIMKYEQIAALKKARQADDAKAVGDSLTDEEYLQYNAIKSIRTSQKRAETTEKKVNTKVAPKFVDGEKIQERTLFESVKTYAEAVGTDPITAFKRIFSGQRIRRVDNNTIIVERMPLFESKKVKQERGSTADMRLDHHLPLQLGGDNSDSNLILVPYDVWKTYTPVENYLGKLLRSDKISKQEAQRLITEFKAGKIKAEEILKL